MLSYIVTSILDGIGGAAIVLTAARIALGLFFAISGYHKIANAQRHATLVTTLQSNGIPFLGVMQWFVPGVELLGGSALMLGALTPLAALGLLAVCFVATITDGVRRVRSYQVLDAADEVDDVLYLPEVLYMFGLTAAISLGAGPYSVDHLITIWLGG